MIASRCLLVFTLMMLPPVLYTCKDQNDSVMKCSKQNKPQRWDGDRWTCN